VCGSGDGKELEKCRESFFQFFFFSYDRVRIYTHTLQYQCNLSLNCNEQYKEKMIATHYGNQIIVNQSTKSIIISNIDSNH